VDERLDDLFPSHAVVHCDAQLTPQWRVNPERRCDADRHKRFRSDVEMLATRPGISESVNCRDALEVGTIRWLTFTWLQELLKAKPEQTFCSIECLCVGVFLRF
jgi:hypothetical protein